MSTWRAPSQDLAASLLQPAHLAPEVTQSLFSCSCRLFCNEKIPSSLPSKPSELLAEKAGVALSGLQTKHPACAPLTLAFAALTGRFRLLAEITRNRPSVTPFLASLTKNASATPLLATLTRIPGGTPRLRYHFPAGFGLNQNETKAQRYIPS